MRSTYVSVLLCSSITFAAINLRAATFERLAGLQKRQTLTCFGSAPEGVLNPCEYVCGEGSRTCVEEGHCFNPTQGDTCCSDATYCPSGYYCSDAGCCKNGLSLEECGATATLATAPGSGAPPTSSSSVETATATTTTSYSETALSSSTLVVPTTYISTSSSSSIAAPTYTTPPSNGTNGTLPSYTPTSSFIPAQQTTNAAYRPDIAGWTLGGFSLLGLGFFL